MNDEPQGIQFWVADLRDVAPPEPFRCKPPTTRVGLVIHRRRCDYHRANWRLVLDTVVDPFQDRFGSGRADADAVHELLDTHIDRTFAGKRQDESRDWALSLLMWPMYATADGWVNGQTRGQAMLDAGLYRTLFAN